MFDPFFSFQLLSYYPAKVTTEVYFFFFKYCYRFMDVNLFGIVQLIYNYYLY